MVSAPALAFIAVFAGTLVPSTWTALTPVPNAGHLPVFAIAVDPTNNQAVIAGTGQGGLYRSADGGARWVSVRPESAAILTIAFSPFNPALVLAGTNGQGALVSTNGGVGWSAVSGLDGRAVRAFGFSRPFVVAGTDQGVYSSADGAAWKASGLTGTSIDAVAVAAVNPPVRLLAGGDAAGGGGIPVFGSVDAGATWVPLAPAVSGTIVTRLAAGALPPNSVVRPLLLGTNSGLFTSSDNGSTFKALSGGQLLPSTDYTQITFTSAHFDRFYVASDGGGSQAGGLWSSDDAGLHFSALDPPLSSVTALAVSSDELPILYVATFRPSDHSPMLWAYRDTGGKPQGPVTTSTPVASSSRTNTPTPAWLDFLRSLSTSQNLYIALGVAALLVLGLAAVSHFRSRRR